MRSFFENLFGWKQESPRIEKCPEPAKRHGPERKESEFYKKGDLIGGNYEVLGTLGKGGFGVVILVLDRSTRAVCALKTFRDELLLDDAARQAFKQEALLWVNPARHPFIFSPLQDASVFNVLHGYFTQFDPNASATRFDLEVGRCRLTLIPNANWKLEN